MMKRRKYLFMIIFGFLLVACNSPTPETCSQHKTIYTAYEQPQEVVPAVNPIEQFFRDLDKEVDFQRSTWTMVVNGVVVAAAWRAEMENLVEILMSRTQNEFVKEVLQSEIYHHTKYIQSRAEMSAMLAASNAFWDYDYFLNFGSLGSITRSLAIAEGYRNKALELMDRVQMLSMGGGWQQFPDHQDFLLLIFNAEEFLGWIKEEYPELWRE